MTENIQEVIDYLEEHTQYWKSKVVKDLATDSEMLNDLIEMLNAGNWIDTGGKDAREAISAAIQEWKK